jgi:type II secretory pathway predicted ATPase ExeA
VREVVQRCEVVTLEPLDNAVRDYLIFKCGRAGVDCFDVFDESVFAAITSKLTLTGEKRQRHSLLYPLAINNLAAASMNLAAELFESRVTGDVVLQVN